MFREAGMIFFYCETPLHAGAGASVSYVDLPIQREKHTEFPIVQSSGVKGALRDRANELCKRGNLYDIETLIKVFGPEPKGEAPNEHGGALSFTDAQILLFPVRSFHGGFAWITCPLIIERFSRFLKMMGTELGIDLSPPNDESAKVGNPCQLKVNNETRIILEDFAFNADGGHSREVEKLAGWIVQNSLSSVNAKYLSAERLKSHLAVISDTCFKDFARLSTDVITRIRIGEEGVVESGALWTQELLLTDTLLYSMVLAKDTVDKNNNRFRATVALKYLKELIEQTPILQIGGDETVGRGLVRLRYLDKESSQSIKEESK